ncbi:ARM repeat-containing protein [Tilletiaria anomala UBC 951]|uniref:ARM repeat-containing protein n=1 Tax=Tilletiaria anomala (strain ATCC 24038 / CBS 436.72 / UBC 951) TaxID=1037660 RepID=A0A066WGS5_TILAU|nr:ARM repeat-containing protein [Tilletiaria anomala UBC 951]KDN49895.1 ARM repeat-containing protein [Tilletiaria anomala UBC 951]
MSGADARADNMSNSLSGSQLLSRPNKSVTGSPTPSERSRSASVVPIAAGANVTAGMADSLSSLQSNESISYASLKAQGLTDDEITLKLEHERQRDLQRQMFAQQMAMLERRQHEEQIALKQTSRASSIRAPNSRQASPPPRENVKVGPAFGNFDDPEEGLHGSNVPGLRSMPDSRRQSGGEEGGVGLVQGPGSKRVASRGDLASAFERMSVGGSGANGSASPHRNGIRAQFDEPDSNPNSRSQSPGGRNLTPAQHSALQRVLAGSGSGASSPKGDGQAPPAGTEGSSFTPVFNENFLFDDELDAESAFVKKYNLQEDDDKFPVLIRRDSFPGMLSASSAALDLAPLSQTPPRFPRGNAAGDAKNSEWPQFVPGRSPSGRSADQDGIAASAAAAADRKGQSERNSPRLSNNQQLPAPNSQGRVSPSASGSGSAAQNARHMAPGTPATGGSGGAGRDRASSGFANGSTNNSNATDNASKAFLDSGSTNSPNFGSFGINSFTAGSKSSASTRFGPYAASNAFETSGNNAEHSRTRPSSGYFEAFSSSTNPPSGLLGNTGKYGSAVGPETNKLPPASTAAAAAAAAAAAGLKQTRKGELDVNTKLEDLQGDIFTLCKDQHGCRYLQKKLEEGVAAHRDMIFAETFPHFAELMTDPFGNYLCQKMLEYCTDDQRNLIVESVAGELVTISLNMHGTRAVQKTIDFLSTPRQIHSIIVALSMNVVTLIKDLNGNHVIQKCLNRLGAEDNQFIYNAVAAHCIEVATHRHGCCVLQRCIDHASDSQRMQLVAEITYNALTLVQDPFGNYVVQYVLDLNDARFSEAVIRQFVGNVCALSVQKFSSNVIEKCVRVSEQATKKQLIEELINRTRLEKLLRDSFANYVVQTALDYADPVQRMQLVECIRPILPMIRNTPYGKRIQSKLHRDNYDLHSHHHPHHHGHHPGHAGMPYSLLQAAHHQQMQAMAALANRQMTPAEYGGMGSFNGPLHPQGGIPGLAPHMSGMYGAPPPHHPAGRPMGGHGAAHMSPAMSAQFGLPGPHLPMNSPYAPPQGSPMMHPGQAEMGFGAPPIGVQGAGAYPGRYNVTY